MTGPPAARELRIGAAEADQRLDRYLRKLLAHVPLGAVFKHLRAGRIRVDGSKARPELRLQEGMVVQLRLGAEDLALLDGAPARRRDASETRGPRGPRPVVVYRDDDVLVVDKPAGLPVQGGRRDDSLVAWLDRKAYGVRTRTFAPAPAHRLDRHTSGLVAIGLSPAALRGLTAAFRERRVTKVYLAVVHDAPDPAAGVIDAPLRRIPAAQRNEPKVTVDARGQEARTAYETIAVAGDRALLRVTPHSGRTHQIRVHLAHLGHPIVGDVRYGSTVRAARFLLHAAELSLPHPTRDKRLELRAEPGPEFALGEGGAAAAAKPRRTPARRTCRPRGGGGGRRPRTGQ